MKLKKFLMLALGIVLSSSALSVAMVKTSEKMQEVAAYASSPAMNWNGYQSIRYHSENNNPDQWGSYKDASSQSAKGTIALNDLSAVTPTSATDGVRTINNTNYQMAGCGTTTLTIKETSSSKQCSGLWVPVATYLDNIPAYAKADVSIRYTLSIVGGTSNNYAVAYLFHLSKDNNGAYDSTQTVNIPSNSTNLIASGVNKVLVSAGNASASTPTSNSAVVENVSVTNESDSLKGFILADFVGLFIGVRKDSSSSHQLTVTLTTNIVSKTETEYIASCNGKLYSTVRDAVSAASNNDTVTLLRDSTSLTNINYGNKAITLDLNGYNLYGTINVLSTGSLSITGTGKIYASADYSTGVVGCAGTLNIGADVTIENTATNTESYAIVSTGTLNFSGIAKGKQMPIKVADGTAYIKGGSVTSSSGYTIFCGSNTNTYFSGTPSIVSTSTGYSPLYLLNSTAKVHGAYNGTYYTGNPIAIAFGNTSASEFTVVDNMYNESKFTVSTSPSSGYGYRYNSSTRSLNHVLLSKYTVTYMANGGTGIVKDSNSYAEGSVATVLASTFDYSYHQFNGWNTAADGSGTSYIVGAKITMTANVVLYAQWTQTSKDECNELSVVYLKFTTYDKYHDNSGATGACTTYYAAAKEYYLNMSSSAKVLFNGDTYSDQRARLAAWAIANGEEFNTSSHTFVPRSAQLFPTNGGNNYIVVIAIAAVAILTLCGVILLKNKKEY